ncbi:hypothetical protein [Anaerophaga thermohalophila]|jgi:DNA replication protein DnaC|uniref:hypothetical protein n=1 Tax=Anaerophaga thermohalophila TaxID=177400 RepID=UPI00030A97A8|nr:hypothetical protein [Anaerophaga thermohalophila]
MEIEVYNDDRNSRAYAYHSNLLVEIANELLAPEGKTFEIGENGEILRFLLYYFNGLREAEQVMPEKQYKIHKNLIICGKVGVGKTFLMRVFEEYLKRTRNPRGYANLSVTQMVNYYKINNHLDRYTYNEENSRTFEGNPVNICLNDIGLKTHTHFGTDTKILIEDFLHARTEIWEQRRKFTHLTTNLTPKQLIEYFDDEYGRLADRFKFYNIIFLKGDSKR